MGMKWSHMTGMPQIKSNKNKGPALTGRKTIRVSRGSDAIMTFQG